MYELDDIIRNVSLKYFHVYSKNFSPCLHCINGANSMSLLLSFSAILGVHSQHRHHQLPGWGEVYPQPRGQGSASGGLGLLPGEEGVRVLG